VGKVGWAVERGFAYEYKVCFVLSDEETWRAASEVGVIVAVDSKSKVDEFVATNL
jgi:hypothetical protein